MTNKSILFTAALALALPLFHTASAQTTERASERTGAPASSAMFSWGAVHLIPGQAVVLNFTVNNDGPMVNLPVDLTLEDKNGNVVYRNTTMVAAGRLQLSADTSEGENSRSYRARLNSERHLSGLPIIPSSCFPGDAILWRHLGCEIALAQNGEHCYCEGMEQFSEHPLC